VQRLAHPISQSCHARYGRLKQLAIAPHKDADRLLYPVLVIATQDLLVERSDFLREPGKLLVHMRWCIHHCHDLADQSSGSSRVVARQRLGATMAFSLPLAERPKVRVRRLKMTTVDDWPARPG
jgi:hypothetical protein